MSCSLAACWRKPTRTSLCVGSRVSSPTALGREAVVTFCRAWLFLFVVVARCALDDTDKNITVCRSQVSYSAAFGREVVAICCLVWHSFVFAGFAHVGCVCSGVTRPDDCVGNAWVDLKIGLTTP